MKASFLSICFIVLGFLVTSSLNAQSPKISIQSTLKDISGKAIPDGTQSITFRLYSAQTGGSALWEEATTVEVVGGIYSHKLGSITPLNVANFGGTLYLGVTVAGGQELNPRTELTAAPYALAVSSLAGGGQSASFLSNGTFNISGFIQSPKFSTNGSGAVTTGRHTVNGDISLNGPLHMNGVINMNGQEIATQGGALNLGFTGNMRATNSLNLRIPDSNPFSLNELTVINDRVGINEPNPRAALHVQKTTSDKPWSNDWEGIFYADPETGVKEYYNSTVPEQIPDITEMAAYFFGAVVATERIASATNLSYSDSRTKKILGVSNSASDLDIINKIKITDYTMIDRKSDNGKYKKVIAQDIYNIFPQATNKMRKVIPDLYCFSNNTKQDGEYTYITIDKKHQLVKGDKIDIYHKGGQDFEINIEGIVDENTFYVKSVKKLEKVFVYGKYVDDFLSVDYDALSMLNISATQELYKRLVTLEEENKTLKTTTANLEERMGKIEALLSENRNAIGSSSNANGQK